MQLDGSEDRDVLERLQAAGCDVVPVPIYRWTLPLDTAPALRLIPGLEVSVLDAGCCGMAGSFGYEKEHYDLSVKIAGLALLPALEKEKEAVVAAPGTSCRNQIRDLAGRRALHPLEVVGEQLEV